MRVGTNGLREVGLLCLPWQRLRGGADRGREQDRKEFYVNLRNHRKGPRCPRGDGGGARGCQQETYFAIDHQMF